MPAQPVRSFPPSSSGSSDAPRQTPWPGFNGSSPDSVSHVSGGSAASCSSSSSSYPAYARDTGSPKHSPDKDYPPDVSHGVLAAIVVPIALVCLAIAGLLFVLSRRRRIHRRKSSSSRSPLAAMEMASPGHNSNNNTVETREHRRSPPPPPNVTFSDLSTSSSSAAVPPVILSDRVNNAYLTGLDTSSQGSASRPVSYGDFDENPARRSLGGTFLEPPPPYQPRSSRTFAEEDEEEPPYDYDDVPLGDDSADALHRARSPFADPYEDEDVPIVADGLQYRRNPFADPLDGGGSPRGARDGMDMWVGNTTPKLMAKST